MLHFDLVTQQKSILTSFFIVTPALLIRHRLFDEIGGYDEEYRYMEDYPLPISAFIITISLIIYQ